MTTPLLTVLCPVLARPWRVAPLCQSFLAASPDTRLLFLAHPSDAEETEEIGAAVAAANLFFPSTTPSGIAQGGIGLYFTSGRTWAEKINEAATMFASRWYLLGADDLSFHKGWINVIRKALMTSTGVIGTNDLSAPWSISGVSSAHPIVSSDYIREHGTYDCPGQVVHPYHHNFADTELVETAKARGLYYPRTDCIVEHLHHSTGKAHDDATYAKGRERVAEDTITFQNRMRGLYQATGFRSAFWRGSAPRRVECLRCGSTPPTRSDGSPSAIFRSTGLPRKSFARI